MSTASALDLAVDDATVLHNSNKLAVRLLPCDVFARIAHAGREVARFEVELGVDQTLLRECRRLVLAMVAAWRFEPGDQFPNRQRAAQELLRALRKGPPWPALDVVTRRAGVALSEVPA